MENILDDIKNCKHENSDIVSEWDLIYCNECGATTIGYRDNQEWNYPTIFHKYIPETKPPEPPEEPPGDKIDFVLGKLQNFLERFS